MNKGSQYTKDQDKGRRKESKEMNEKMSLMREREKGEDVKGRMKGQMTMCSESIEYEHDGARYLNMARLVLPISLLMSLSLSFCGVVATDWDRDSGRGWNRELDNDKGRGWDWDKDKGWDGRAGAGGSVRPINSK